MVSLHRNWVTKTEVCGGIFLNSGDCQGLTQTQRKCEWTPLLNVVRQRLVAIFKIGTRADSVVLLEGINTNVIDIVIPNKT